MDPLQHFEEIKQAAETNYKAVGEVFCPYFDKQVGFNAKGLDHIKMKGWNKARVMSDQYLRLKFLRLAPLIIGKTGTLQEFTERKNFERVQINSRWEHRAVLVRYYGFVAIVGKLRVKIVLNQVEEGRPYCWSIIPFWKTKADPITGEIKKIFHDGDLENQ